MPRERGGPSPGHLCVRPTHPGLGSAGGQPFCGVACERSLAFAHAPAPKDSSHADSVAHRPKESRMYIKESIEVGGKTLTIETGKMAKQADGAVVVRYGDTMVLVTAVANESVREGLDFMPLTVEYVEKTASAGKIPGGYFKREGRPTEREILTCRLIDRPSRPLFAKTWRSETQIIGTVLSF